ncbi:carbon-nitrogen family hydrolase [Bacillus cytotoxicus]|uniref:Nitrilase/cyanide hydratase and apolipoprotein N-acyltransferase n=1 Tax=Bacillus cytotoxicus (strain DSM 22905 / CIP 110041 / 391-98 / NVH 391-98) TaxID=315749 RepID=A7GS58_BACCN|nr:Nitrilase/cyanide hydratase and apolipoprotein N-acyltransferase [Bacillus cytotoxicus NVH 391-98]AWC29621.1 carbon-nitrogen family hydrolase [Bacillus cytotoxicus]AWC41753.1 carbon-nitrogen family hydrolase [Bacillus cytotoxicus]AWC45597.1 carbon-nitrogen family hydrolase [Bacillus cytotoxicus]AWC49684.1 carbon-nitrogen family hydrolase [Bacillus cytotoxicus]
MKVACIQMDIVFGEVTLNTEHAEKKIEEAMKVNPDVIVLPELWTTGYDLKRLPEISDKDGKQTKEVLSKWAKEFSVNIVGGSVAKQTEKGVTNTMYIMDRQGNVQHEYSKVHLFQLMNEHKYLIAGHETGEFTLDEIQCGGVICYDIRFPEWIRVHTAKGAKIVFVVAEWPLVRLEHWRLLLQARAIENQCYVVACNRVGKDPNNVFGGHSLIIDPWGKIVAEAQEEESILYGQIELEKIEEVRRGIPVFMDRRLELYK